MGNAKWTEQIVERYVESAPTRWTTVPGTPPKIAPTPKVRYCPLCLDGYLDERGLQDHIAKAHGREHVYLTVDDVIVRDVCWTADTPRKCSLVTLNMPPLDVRIAISGQTLGRCRTSEGRTELGHWLRDRPDTEVCIRVEGGPRRREYTIYQGRQPTFRADRLDEAIRDLQRNLISGIDSNLCDAHQRFRGTITNDLERRYFEGFIDYCHGFVLESRGDWAHARGRLEAAMEALLPFSTAMAGSARCVLALRMNCFSTLQGCEPGSPFAPARAFFCYNLREYALPASQASSLGECGVYVDPQTIRLLDILTAFYARDDARVLSEVGRFQADGLIRDRNDEDKLALIEARVQLRCGNEASAAEAYDRLKFHPVFSDEAACYGVSWNRRRMDSTRGG